MRTVTWIGIKVIQWYQEYNREIVKQQGLQLLNVRKSNKSYTNNSTVPLTTKQKNTVRCDQGEGVLAR